MMNGSVDHRHQFVKEKVDAVSNLIESNQQLTTEIIVNTINIPVGSAHIFLSE